MYTSRLQERRGNSGPHDNLGFTGVSHTNSRNKREDNNPMDKYSKFAVLRDGVIVGHACSVKLMHSL